MYLVNAFLNIHFNSKQLQPIFRTVGNGQLFPRPFDNLNTQFWKFLCYPYPIQMKMCLILDMWSFGFDYGQIDPVRITCKTLFCTLLTFRFVF